MFSLENQKDTLTARVQKISPEQGDILVLRFPTALPDQMRDQLCRDVGRLSDRIKKDITFFVLEDGASMEVVSTSKFKDAA